MVDRPIAVILAGMHRSGTSLLGSYLMHSGIDMGERLLGPNSSNIYGHFEDEEFLGLQKASLKRLTQDAEQGSNWLTKRLVSRRLPQFTVEEKAVAIDLVARRRAKREPWGWKDPQTCLFLDFWAEVVPEARFVFVFRHPLLVADSLCRRANIPLGDKKKNSSALGMWIGYNREVLKFYYAHRERSILFSLERAIENPNSLAGLLSKSIAYPFTAEKFSECFDPGVLNVQINERRRTSLRLWAKATRLHQQLLDISEL